MKSDPIPWSRFFGWRCPARATGYGEVYHCDLARHHRGDHRAERGMYDIVWSSLTAVG